MPHSYGLKPVALVALVRISCCRGGINRTATQAERSTQTPMKRAASERLRTLHVWRKHSRAHRGEVLCRCEWQPGRFRKAQRVGGCGRPQCWLCHYDKLAGLATLQERRALARLNEGVAESLFKA